MSDLDRIKRRIGIRQIQQSVGSGHFVIKNVGKRDDSIETMKRRVGFSRK